MLDEDNSSVLLEEAASLLLDDSILLLDDKVSSLLEDFGVSAGSLELEDVCVSLLDRLVPLLYFESRIQRTENPLFLP